MLGWFGILALFLFYSAAQSADRVRVHAPARSFVQLQRERYKISREVRPDEVFDFSVARSLQAK